MKHVQSIAVKNISMFMSQGLITLTEVELDSAGNLQSSDVCAACTPNTHLVSVMLANNETGVVFDIADIVRHVKKEYPGLLFHTDAAQAIGKCASFVGIQCFAYLQL